MTIGSGATFAGSTFTHSLYGNWSNSGAFTANTSTIELLGSSNITITGATTFNVLTINKSSSANTVTLNNNIQVATINMTNGRLLTGSNSVTITTTRNGNGIIIGTIIRTHTFSNGVNYEFESPNNFINFSTVGTVSSVTVRVVLGAVSGFANAINREYNISVTGAGYTAALRLHYEDSELNGNSETDMNMWQYNGAIWVPKYGVSRNTSDNWIELGGLNDITNRWTCSDDRNIVRWNGSVSSSWATAGNWTVVEGSPSTPPASNDIVYIGDNAITNQPIVSSSVTIRSIQFGSAQAATLTLNSGGTLTTIGNINGIWSADATHTIAVGTQTLNVGGDLILSEGTSNRKIDLTISSGTVSVTGSITMSGGANITFSGAGNLSVGGDYNYVSGTFTPNTSTVTYTGNSAQTVVNLPYYNLTINKTGGTASTSTAITATGSLTLSSSAVLALGGDLNVTGNININSGTTLQANNYGINFGGNWVNGGGTFTAGSSTVTLNGTNAQTIDATTFNNLVINKSSGIASLNNNITISGNLSVTTGLFDLSTYTANRSVLGGTFTLNGGTTLRLAGANNFPTNYSTNTLNSTSTVEYYGSVAQTVAAVTYGNLTLSNGGANAKTLAGATVCVGNLLINSGATFGGGATTLNAQGNWTNDGTFNGGTSTITLSGASKTLGGASATTFNNLTVTGSYTASSNITVSGTMNVSGGSYSAGSTTTTFSGNYSNTGTFTSSGVVTFSGTSLQTIAMNSGFTSTGTVNFNGTVAPTFSCTSSPTFAILNINNTSAGGIAPNRGWNINGAFTVASGALFNGSSYTHTLSNSFTNNGTVTLSSGVLNVQGDWINNSTFNQGTSTVTLSGTTKSLGGTANTTFNNLTISGSYTGSRNITVNAALNITGTGNYNAGSTTVTLGGNLSNSGTFTSSGVITFSGAQVQNLALNSGFNSTGTVNFNGTVAPTFSGASSPQFTTLNINNTSASGISPGVGWTVNGVFTVSNGTTFNGGSATHIFNSTFTNNGTVTSGGTMRFSPSSATTITLRGTTFTSTGIIEFSGSGLLTIVGTPQTVTNLSITNTNASGVTLPAGWTINGDLNIAGASIFNASSFSYTINGSILSSGTFNGQTSTVTMAGASEVIDGSLTTTFNNLVINNASTITVTTGFNINGNFTNNGTFDATGNNITFTGTSQSTISGTSPGFEDLTIAKSNASVVLAVDLSGLGDLTISSGTLNLSTYSISGSGNLFMDDATTMLISSTAVNPVPLFATYDIAPGSTIEFNSASGQTIPAFNYGNLRSSSTGARTLASSGTIGIAGTFTIGTNSYTITGSTIDYNGTGVQTIPAFNYNNLTISGARTTNNVTLVNGGTIGIAGAFTPSATFTSGNYVTTNNTINYNNTTAQTIAAFNYNNLTISGARTTNNVTFANSGTIGIAGTLTLSATFSTGGYITTGSTVDYNGSGAQTIIAFNYNNLNISGARTTNNVTLVNGGTIGIAGAFTPSATFTSGNYVTTNNTINYNNTTAQTIAAFNYNNLTISGARTTNNVTFANSGTIGIAGTLTLSATFSTGGYITTGSTVDYNGSGAQTVLAFNYNNLTISGARTTNNVTLVNGGTIGIAGAFTPSATFTSGNYITTNNTINFNGTGAQTINAFNYNNLTLSGARGNENIILENGNYIRVAGAFVNSASLYNVINTNNTFEYNGSTAQTVTPFTYNNLILSGSGAKTVSSSQTANGNVTQQAGTALTIDGIVVWQIDGLLSTQTNFINNGEIIIGN